MADTVVRPQISRESQQASASVDVQMVDVVTTTPPLMPRRASKVDGQRTPVRSSRSWLLMALVGVACLAAAGTAGYQLGLLDGFGQNAQMVGQKRHKHENCAMYIQKYEDYCQPLLANDPPVCPTYTVEGLIFDSDGSCQDLINAMFQQCDVDAGSNGGSLGCAANEVQQSRGLFSGGTACVDSFNWFPYTGETSPSVCETVTAELGVCYAPYACQIVDGKVEGTFSLAAIIGIIAGVAALIGACCVFAR